ncbi:hypothetical protein Bsph_p079 (plasmid) [Lysinibacillus sphaericus C3-41]|uniref:Uncharacterized protein n=2 Tax=Bacillaceae TaxID=186817 RepID=B1I0F0_LYSSC|nr:hypothetical protein Bsph_p079 [Lysinibacillus sphaericus C3-41]
MLLKCGVFMKKRSFVKDVNTAMVLKDYKEYENNINAVGANAEILVGTKEFAEILGWTKAKLSTKYSRQRDGQKVKDPLPEPIQLLAATPVWTLEQAMNYKKSLSKEE